jgi:hypothetical protein
LKHARADPEIRCGIGDTGGVKEEFTDDQRRTEGNRIQEPGIILVRAGCRYVVATRE